MRKILYIVIVFAIGTNGAWGDPAEFTVAADPDYAPFTFRDSHGKPTGLFIDLWNLWAEENNYTVRYRFYDWNDTLKAVETGEVDFHSGTSNDYPWMHVSDPIYEVKTALYTLDDRKHIATKDALKGLTVGVVDPYYGEMVLRACRNTCTVTVYDTYSRLINAALGGKIDALVDDIDALTYYFIRNGILSRFTKQPITLHKNDLVYAVTNAEKRSILPLINEGLHRLPPAKLLAIENRWLPNVSDGYYHRLFGREHALDATMSRIGWGVVLLLLLLLIYLHRLRKLHRNALAEALEDELTGLRNKRAFERLSLPDARNIALVLIDADHFKEYNDTYGHLAGDKLLRRIADILRDSIDDATRVFRIGGDEYAIALFDTDARMLEHIGSTILEVIRLQAIPHEHTSSGFATVTVGASIADLPIDRHRIFQCADTALYAAKQQGRDRFVLLPCDEEAATVSV
jgi:diguanylate cyclase (GGDEF)-like protein